MSSRLVRALLLAALGLFFRGPFSIGIPAFAEAHLAEGAAGFGLSSAPAEGARNSSFLLLMIRRRFAGSSHCLR